MQSVLKTGGVWIVGAGPGDPDLLTLKALKAIEGSDLILYDHLVSPAIRALFPKTIPAFYVGKAKGHHSIAQSDLNALLVKKAKEGKTICRLKGGDPFVFGRGGEELMALREAGIHAEVIPGITAASGASTYSGIPLTHRGVSQGCTFVTGHGEKALKLNWQSLANLRHTLVFYMGLTSATMIQSRLLEEGMDPNTPAALIENGCRDNQRTVTTTLAELVRSIETDAVQAPALIVIGDVVSCAEQLAPASYFEDTYFAKERLTA